ncbi:MAG: restriction endonuclease subunit S [Alistipes sp.]|nr:restriction endonuclease subunit S [Alistipes sp.]
MTTKNNIPVGYKDSAVGVIPQEWEVKRIQEICKVDAKSLSAKTSPDYEFEYISLSDVDSDSFDISTSHQIFQTAPSRARRIVSKGDVVISTVRPNLRGFFLAKEDKKDLIASTGFAVLTPTECDSQYLLSCFFSQIVSKQFYSLVVGSNYPAVNSSDVAKLKLAVPPLAEQRKIAEILGVWDEAIEKQIQLIEKLELRKRGLMQRLLTGRIHLPGFTTPWQKVKLGEIGTITSAGVDKKINDGEVPVRLLNFVDVFYRDFLS